jgi:patatin-like phospholipase/acyl hydrolase
MSSNSGFRILSLDGGGIKGVFTASFLNSIEEMSGGSIADYFDLITGTSTGGIIAVALGMGLPCGEILKFYRDRGPVIFPSTGAHRRLRQTMRRFVVGKHDHEVLATELRSVFGDQKLGESRCRLVIPAFNASSGMIHLFKTAHDERFRQDYKRTCVDVLMAAVAAPTYFRPHRTEDGSVFIDGGVWAGNPALVGVLEALRQFRVLPGDIDLLSIGTTEEPFHLSRGRRLTSGMIQWARGILPLFMQAQTDAAMKQAALLLDRAPLRVSPVVAPKRFSIDDTRRIQELCALGVAEARINQSAVRERFLLQRAPRFLPALVSA